MFKYLKLEQYEDTLTNIVFIDREGQTSLEVYDDYMLRYMLDFETRDSSCLLNIDALSEPFKYSLKIKEKDETRIRRVDLIETFNYIIGINVTKRYSTKNDGRKYVIVRGKVDNRYIIVIWRNTQDLDLEEDRNFINKSILKGYEETIYINGDSLVEGAIPLEKEFKYGIEGR